ncbi:polyphosphate polymerase domain-containing protein [Candidatus Sumerlaeota bacterium]|nr:polyphosphate polymerase domain-containing protein [Candidatus Sumerlaeota bacterium]
MDFPHHPRYELKIVARHSALSVIRSMVMAHPAGFITAYPPRRVNNVYFDTFDLYSLQQHVSGVSQRSKIRFRWYGNSLKNVSGRLEIKNKRDRLSWKISAPINDTIDFETMSWQEIVTLIRRAVPPHLQVAFDLRSVPVFINFYLREYYVSPTYNVRITLDYAHKAYEQWSSTFPQLHTPLLLPATVIIELKAEDHQRYNLAEILNDFPLRPTRNSKYVNCVHPLIY